MKKKFIADKKISAAIMFYKVDEQLLKEMIDHCLHKFDEVILMDTSSNTSSLNAIIHPIDMPKVGFAKARNILADYCNNDWVFMIDSDELIHPNVYEELKNINKTTMFPRLNKIHAKKYFLEGYPDYQVRYYNKTKSYFIKYISEELYNTGDIYCSKFHLHHTNLYETNPSMRYYKYSLYNYFNNQSQENLDLFYREKNKVLKDSEKKEIYMSSRRSIEKLTPVTISDKTELEVVEIEEKIYGVKE